MNFSSLLEALVELFYPRLCVVCHRNLVSGESFLCSACLQDMPLTDESYFGEDVLPDRFTEESRPEALYSLFYYSKYNDYKNLIYAVKYRSKQELGVYLGKMLGERIKELASIDAILPIPLHPRREKKRGFNQAMKIAAGIAEVLGVEMMDRAVVRIKNNASQTGMNPEERQKNVENIFRLEDPALFEGKHVLIVDDVITTGATIASCANALKEAANVRFSLACLARTLL